MISLKYLVWTLGLVASWEDQRTTQVITTLLADPNCPAIVAVFDSDTNQDDADLEEEFIRHQSTPITLLHSDNVNWENVWNKEPACQNVVIFARESSTKSVPLYRQIKNRFFVNKAAIVVRCSDQEAGNIVTEISNENFFLVVERQGKDLQLFTWKADNKTTVTTIKRETRVSKEIIYQHAINLSGRHLIIGILNNPPSVLIDKDRTIRGIEPSLLETLAGHLKFSFEFVQAAPNEMWGNLIRNGTNITFTGLLGMVVRKEIDVAIGNFYQSSYRWPYVSFTIVYTIGYESFLVPAPKPYEKWTAVFYSFTLSIWIATIISCLVIAIMLRFGSTWSTSAKKRPDVFSEFEFCCLYVLGNLLTVQMQPQSILSNASRMYLIWWLFGTLILTTGYKSELISHMTLPITPPAIDTIQQLVGSPLKKVVFGGFSKGLLMNTSSHVQRKLGHDLIPFYNLTEMYTLLDSGSAAVESDLDNLLYTAATMFPTAAEGPRVHLMKETILPIRAAFGLQRNSQLKPYLDRDIQCLFEAGIVDYHKTRFAKKMNDWNPRKANMKISFSLKSLQGAFYILTFGLVMATIFFILEILHFSFKRR